MITDMNLVSLNFTLEDLKHFKNHILTLINNIEEIERELCISTKDFKDNKLKIVPRQLYYNLKYSLIEFRSILIYLKNIQFKSYKEDESYKILSLGINVAAQMIGVDTDPWEHYNSVAQTFSYWTAAADQTLDSAEHIANVYDRYKSYKNDKIKKTVGERTESGKRVPTEERESPSANSKNKTVPEPNDPVKPAQNEIENIKKKKEKEKQEKSKNKDKNDNFKIRIAELAAKMADLERDYTDRGAYDSFNHFRQILIEEYVGDDEQDEKYKSGILSEEYCDSLTVDSLMEEAQEYVNSGKYMTYGSEGENRGILGVMSSAVEVVKSIATGKIVDQIKDINAERIEFGNIMDEISMRIRGYMNNLEESIVYCETVIFDILGLSAVRDSLERRSEIDQKDKIYLLSMLIPNSNKKCEYINDTFSNIYNFMFKDIDFSEINFGYEMNHIMNVIIFLEGNEWINKSKIYWMVERFNFRLYLGSVQIRIEKSEINSVKMIYSTLNSIVSSGENYPELLALYKDSKEIMRMIENRIK